MKTTQRILFILLCIALIVISAGFLLPRKVHVERSLMMSASTKNIFRQINVLKNWEKWSPWMQMDSAIQMGFSGPESGVGAECFWKSHDKNVVNGSIAIISSASYDSILVIMDFGKKGKLSGKFLLLDTNQRTKVTWSVESNLGTNPISRWFGLLSDHMIGPDLERGLFNLNEILADIVPSIDFEIIECEVPARILLCARDTVSANTVEPKLALMYQQISEFLKSRNLSPTGVPLTIFYGFSNQAWDIEACMPIGNMVEGEGGLKCIQTEVQKALMIEYMGPYTLISNAYNAIQTEIRDRGLLVSGRPWEEYITNPLLHADTVMRQTNVYFPVR